MEVCRVTDWMDKEKYEHAKRIAEEHWSYVRKVIEEANPYFSDVVMGLIEFHYVTAMTHGYGHGAEDAKDE